jgi:hypothetical protein
MHRQVTAAQLAHRATVHGAAIAKSRQADREAAEVADILIGNIFTADLGARTKQEGARRIRAAIRKVEGA